MDRPPFRFLNTHSALTLGAAAAVLVLAAGWLLVAPWLGAVLAAAVAAALTAWALTMRTRPAPIASFDRLEATLRSGRPTLLEVYSNY